MIEDFMYCNCGISLYSFLRHCMSVDWRTSTFCGTRKITYSTSRLESDGQTPVLSCVTDRAFWLKCVFTVKYPAWCEVGFQSGRRFAPQLFVTSRLLGRNFCFATVARKIAYVASHEVFANTLEHPRLPITLISSTGSYEMTHVTQKLHYVSREQSSTNHLLLQIDLILISLMW